MTETTTGFDQAALLDAFDALTARLNSELVEREAEIHGLNLALVSRTHLFMIGQPGVAKSYLVDRAYAAIEGMRVFKELLTKFSTPNEIHGPLNAGLLKEGRYVRVTESYAPTAELWFLDEIWKSNSALLNANLMALNERMMRNDGRLDPIVLSTMICCSNELPENMANENRAIYDRIEQRFEVLPVQDNTNFVRMLALPPPDDTLPAVITWDQILVAQKLTSEIEVDVALLETLADLRRKLKDELGIEPTERRWRQSIKVLKGEAFLDGCQAVEKAHLSALKNVLWDTPEQLPEIEKIVMEFANPLQRKVADLSTDVEGLAKALDAAIQDPATKSTKGFEAFGKLERAAEDYISLENEAGGSRRQAEQLNILKTRIYTLIERALREVFDLSEAEMASIDLKNPMPKPPTP